MKNNFLNSTLTAITILLLAGCASMTQAPTTPPSATVRIREWSAAYYGSAAAGKGTLYYNGRQHHFTISGLGIGGMGVQRISATGKVYNLNNLSQFSGTYHGIARGLTLIEGKMQAPLGSLACWRSWFTSFSPRRSTFCRRPELRERLTRQRTV